MHQILISKLAGLLGRPVYQMPFSRAIRMDLQKARRIRQLTTQCMEEGGVMMVQPEHLLSFQLMGLESQIDGQNELASQLLGIQHFFDVSARDIVDESDENFSVKFELVYTIGRQQPIDYSPDRWALIQEALRLVAKFSTATKRCFPQSVDLDNRHAGRFPRIRILGADAEAAIFRQVADFICETGISGFPIARQPTEIRDAVRCYITKLDLSSDETRAVKNSAFWGETTIKPILLLRGLLAGGILAFALGQKRWRVNYGTDDKRERATRLAVPFRAKDSPMPRSEFSHPDVIIVLTCLSYYYSGIGNNDLFCIFEQLSRSESPDSVYQDWIRTAPSMPQPYRQLRGVNLRDRMQCVTEIFPHLRYSKGAIDYFLSRLVFAKESREFPHRLSASGWDLGKAKSRPMTGFSGTNDSRYVLPLDVRQLDLSEQKHTNALVLEYLLRPENSIKLVPRQAGQSVFDSESLLGMMAQMSKHTRVVLDVGAQIIDVSNQEFAERWLRQHDGDNSTQAVVFFNDADELLVFDKSGNVEELQVSPFATQLDLCLIFLDESHTRGTDLKLPAEYQAAVTLGANLTKDRLVQGKSWAKIKTSFEAISNSSQACMRMRRLGKGQSVVFCIPWEVEHKILTQQSRNPSSTGTITVSDVLCWVIAETWLDLRRSVPLWLTQGCRFHRQLANWDADPGAQDSTGRKTKWAQAFLEDESQSLEEHYQPDKAYTGLASLLEPVEEKVRARLRQRCDDFGLAQLQRSAALQEEQERELSPEAEREQQVELPPPVEARCHAVHADVRHFIVHGEFPERPQGLKPAFTTLRDTSAAGCLNVDEFPRLVWVSEDFYGTVKASPGHGSHLDLFQRCVQWVLTSNNQAGGLFRLLLISPYEAQELIPSIEMSKHVTLHLYSPRTSLEQEPLDSLALYNIPQRKSSPRIPAEVIVQLNLFSGQLYLSSWEEYKNVCEALGLAWMTANDSTALRPDGFILPGPAADGLANRSGLTKSPTKFIKVLMSRIRQNCETIERTHMGKILDGVILGPDDFQEANDDDNSS